jgi:hypothetical protein
VLDSNGQPVTATGADGKDGEKGATGATGPQGDAIFAENGVDNSNPDYVEFTLADDNTKIQVPKYRPLSIDFTQPAAFTHAETRNIGFTVTGNVQRLTAVDVPRGWTVGITRAGNAGTFTLTTSDDACMNCEALILAADADRKSLMRTLNLSRPPSYAASTRTWTFDSSPLVWSDAIRIPECNNGSIPKSTTNPHCRSSGSRYYYNWPYVNANSSTLCPSPWRVPTRSDFDALAGATNGATLVSEWDAGGIFDGDSHMGGDALYYWSSTASSSTQAYLIAKEAGMKMSVSPGSKVWGIQVRCVK